jgi:putative transposase
MKSGKLYENYIGLVRSPWENAYVESFNGKFRDELLNGEIFDTILESRVVTEQWRRYYNTLRPHSAFGVQTSGTRNIYSNQVANDW